MGSDNTSDTVTNKIGEEMVKRDENGRVVGGVLNPNGRPKKGQALTDLMREMMEENPDIKRAIMARLMKGAADGDIAFIREVLDRIEGKPTQKNDITSNGSTLKGLIELHETTDPQPVADKRME